MNVWLDDNRKPGSDCDRFLDWNDWDIWTKRADTAIALLHCPGLVTSISLDHDLGTNLTGYDVACEIERMAVQGTLGKIKVYVHSFNPVAAERMRVALRKAQAAWKKREKT